MKRVIGGKEKLILGIVLLFVAICISVCIIPTQARATDKNENYEELEALELDSNSLGANLNESKLLDSEICSIGNGYITKILPQTTVQDLKNNLDCQEIQVYNKNNAVLKDNELVGTGYTLKVQNEEYKLAVAGDVTGDGKIGLTDLVQISLANVGLRAKFSGEYHYAADLNYSGKVTITDVTRTNLAITNIVDIIAPNSFVPEIDVTLSSITVTGETSDANSGMKEYWYEIDKNGWVANSVRDNNQYTFSNLQSNKEYTIRMKVIDNAGNVKITKRIKVKTKAIEDANIKISASTEEWTNQNIMVAINYNSNIAEETKQISLDNGQTWSEYTDPIRVEKNTKIKARVINASGKVIEEQEKEITNIDKLSPRDFNITINSTTNSITVAGQTQDSTQTSEYGRSGLKEYEYRIEKEDWLRTYTTTNTSYTFENLEHGAEYKVTVKAIDNAGNETKAKNSAGLDEHTIKTPTIDDVIEEMGGEIVIRPSTEEWTNQNITVEVTYPSVTGLQKEISVDNGVNWKIYSGPETIQENTVIRARMKDNDGKTSSEKILEIANIDKLAPKELEITTTHTETGRASVVEYKGGLYDEYSTYEGKITITVLATAEDAEKTSMYGKSEIVGYQFKVDDGEWSEVSTSGEYTFNELELQTEYIVEVRAIDGAGNIKEEKSKLVIYESIDELIENHPNDTNIKIYPSDWTNQDVKVKFEYAVMPGFEAEISLDEGKTWNTYTKIITVGKNMKVQARIREIKTNKISSVVQEKITNIDKLAPDNFTITATPTSNSISVTVNADDHYETEEYGKSGIYGYSFKINDEDWTAPMPGGAYEFTNLTQGQNYKIRVKAIDNAGNETYANKNGSVDGQTIQTPTVEDIVRNLGEIQLRANTTDFTNQNVYVEAIYPEAIGYTKEISIDAGVTWNEYKGVVEVTQNTTVMARLKDSKGQVGGTVERKITNIDKLAPNDFEITATSTKDSIIVNSTGTTDTSATNEYACSGIREYKYVLTNELWKWEATSNTTSYTFSNLIPGISYEVKAIAIDNAGNETLTATWEEIKCTLTFDTSFDVSVYPISITKKAGETVRLPVPTRSYQVTYYTDGGEIIPSDYFDFEFNYWVVDNVTAGSPQPPYSFYGTPLAQEITMPSENKTLYANWKNTSMTLPTPTKTGYIFVGWYEDSELTEEVKMYGDSNTEFIPYGDMTLYAKWEPIDCTITYDANGGTGVLPYTTGKYGDTITLPTPTKEYTVTLNAKGGTLSSSSTQKSTYTFRGWYTSQTGGYRVNDEIILLEDRKLYARWDDGYITLPTPTLEGWTLEG